MVTLIYLPVFPSKFRIAASKNGGENYLILRGHICFYRPSWDDTATRNAVAPKLPWPIEVGLASEAVGLAFELRSF